MTSPLSQVKAASQGIKATTVFCHLLLDGLQDVWQEHIESTNTTWPSRVKRQWHITIDNLPRHAFDVQ